MKKITKIFVVILAISVIAMIGIFTASCKVTPGPVTTDVTTTQKDTTYAPSTETTSKNVETKDTTKVEPVTETTETEATETETTTEKTTTPEETTTVEAGFGRVTLVYVDDTGKEIDRRAENGLYRIGGEYATPTIYIDGYKFQSVDGPHSELQEPGMEGYIVFSVTGAENVYTFRYTRNSYAFNVSYTVGDNTVIENYSYPYTSTYKYTIVEKDGYVPVSYVISIGSDDTEVKVDKVPYVIEGTMPYADVNITVKYATSITFKHVDENGNEISRDVYSYDIGDEYTYVIPYINGYTCTENRVLIKGTVDSSKTIEVHYKKTSSATEDITVIVDDYTPSSASITSYPYIWVNSKYIDNTTGIGHVKVGVKKTASSQVQYLSFWWNPNSGISYYGMNRAGTKMVSTAFFACGINLDESTVSGNNTYIRYHLYVDGNELYTSQVIHNEKDYYDYTSTTVMKILVPYNSSAREEYNITPGAHNAKIVLEVYQKNGFDRTTLGTFEVEMNSWWHTNDAYENADFINNFVEFDWYAPTT